MSATETVGVDLGGTKLLVGVVDEGCAVHHRSVERSSGQTEDALMKMASRAITDAIAVRPDVRAVGLGVPCTIDRERGVAIAAVNLPITDVPIAEILSQDIDLPLSIDNDANLAALAEHCFGAARGADNVVMVTVGTGIGGGLILNGELYRGSIGAGAELGHTVIEMDGPRCQGSCPGRGCVESLASGTAMGREGSAAAQREPDSALGKALAAGTAIDGKVVTDAAIGGDTAAREVVELIGRRLGIALASFANIFDPDVIVVGGGVAAAGGLLIGPAQAEIRDRALAPMNKTPVVVAQLGADAGMIGAAAMARLESEAQ